MRKCLVSMMGAFWLAGLSVEASPLNGQADTWLLYITDNFDTQSVLEVYETNNCDDVSDLEPIYVAYGNEREDVQCDNGRCCIERVIRDGEIIVERVIDNNGSRQVTKEYDAGDTLLQSLGLKADYQKEKWKAVIDGDFRYHYLGSRTLYGSKKHRFHITDLYAETKTKLAGKDFRFRGGRQNVFGGVIVDGLRSDWLWDSDGNKSLGLFAGLAPDHRTKNPDLERLGFGSHFHFIPDFSSGKTKLLIDASLYGETYKLKMNRFSLFTRSHFTPIPSLSLFHYSTLELPVPGEDTSITSSYFSLRAFYRPHRQWTFSAGASQFRIHRYLQQESVRWFTDEGSLQSERVGGSLDRSDRYRLDARISYKAFPLVHPYLSGRYERRSIDGNKTFLNRRPNSPDDNTLPEEDLSLINRKNAYGGSLGFRLFPWDNIETDSRITYNRRFQSTAYDLYQEVSWAPGSRWSLDSYFQVLWSARDIKASLPTGVSTEANTQDYYAGLGGSYRFRSDIFSQIRYDFACEDDHSLDANIFIHSFLLRLDYRF